jgi:hypothetical protein
MERERERVIDLQEKKKKVFVVIFLEMMIFSATD